MFSKDLDITKSPNKNSSPKLTSQYYQQVSQRYLIVPFCILLGLLFGIYSFFDLQKIVNDEIADARLVNQLLAQTAAQQQVVLLTQQIEAAKNSRPIIINIVFYPITAPESKIVEEKGLNTIFFDSQLGVNEPVYVLKNQKSPLELQEKKLLGYIQTTLDLKLIRKEWLMGNLLMFFMMAILTAAILVAALFMVKKITRRLPLLEKLSQTTLNVDIGNATTRQIDALISEANLLNQQFGKNSQRWVFEKALMYLLNNIRLQSYRFDESERNLQHLKHLLLSQTIERSKIQNIMVLELKVALKRIQAGLQLLVTHYISQEQQDAVEIIEQGVGELNQKMDQIIQLQRIERGQIGVEQQSFDLNGLIEDLLAKYTQLAEEKNLALSYKNCHVKYTLEGDVQKITTILASLIENALQYTETGSITITSRIYHLQEAIQWQVAVSDTGIGIDKVHFDDIFDPFFQVNPGSYEDITMFGVDLSLVKKLAQMIGAEVEVESQLGMGSTFTVTFLVKDWTQHFDRMLLENKHLAFLYQSQTYQILGKKLRNAGARIEEFNDVQLLMNCLMLHEVDALLITSDFSMSKVIELTQMIRASQTSQRITIIYYYDSTAIMNFDELRAAGVDYFEAFSAEDNNQDAYVKHLFKRLS